MACINCENCKQGDITYFCFDKNDLVVADKVKTEVVEKTREGWKKGDPNYEVHRRKSKKKVEV